MLKNIRKTDGIEIYMFHWNVTFDWITLSGAFPF